ncbi:MAG TPA: hypothetical protein VKT82_01460 [Ktedonobacterales bacterium]|nr:hypothetical protein [Ktedonobacterales bacterium]
MSESSTTQPEQDGRADFDFFMGKWKVHHRMLRKRLKGSQEWEECEGVAVAHKVLNGLGNVDEITVERPSGSTVGMTVRLFDPASRLWSLYWADSVHGWNYHTAQLGAFKDGRGEFYACDPFEGKSIFSRYIWSSSSATSCRWEQAFSEDAGKTWESNWIMDFERIS